MNVKAVGMCILLAAVATGVKTASAQSVSGSEGTGEVSRSIDLPDLSRRKIVDRSPKIGSDETRRDLPIINEPSLDQAFTTRSKSRDGSMRSIPPSGNLMNIIKQEIHGAIPERQPRPPSARDNASGETDRKVIEPDERLRISKTTAYPFRAIGQLWSVNDHNEWSTCSATLIGSRAIITAAHCLYSHEDGGWLHDYEFYPGLNGKDGVPFGKYSWKNAYVLQGFIDNYSGSYGSAMPWDLGILILDDTAGSSLGWLGYSVYDPAYNFTANIVGYPGDKKESTMWRSTCNVDASLADKFNFIYDCDTYPGSSGSAVYDYNSSTKSRSILGVNVAEDDKENIGTRLTRGNFAWVNQWAGN
ncbi:serine protease [Mesorhizobium sp. M0913]|uniref:trypsin-like serine peptidase n=1 Tax=Mesorhizobium sp. M0913 TaxID=2957026 RepID=UPI00333737B6